MKTIMIKTSPATHLFNFIAWVGQRGIALYIIFFLVSLFLVDNSKIRTGAQIRTLHYLNPSAYDYLVGFINKEEALNKKKLNEYIYYYEQTIRYVPQSAESYSMLGFLFYHLGKKREATSFYEKAVELNSNNFWTYYNLGVISSKENLTSKSIDYLKEALTKNSNQTLESITSSQTIFAPILQRRQRSGYKLMKQLRDGHRDCYLLLILNYYQSNNFQEMLRVSTDALLANVGFEEIFYYYMGLAWYHLGENFKAIASFQKSIQIDQHNPDAFHYLSLSYQTIGKDGLAKENLLREDVLRKEMTTDMAQTLEEKLTKAIGLCIF